MFAAPSNPLLLYRLHIFFMIPLPMGIKEVQSKNGCKMVWINFNIWWEEEDSDVYSKFLCMVYRKALKFHSKMKCCRVSLNLQDFKDAWVSLFFNMDYNGKAARPSTIHGHSPHSYVQEKTSRNWEKGVANVRKCTEKSISNPIRQLKPV